MSDQDLRNKLIRLAHSNPELRSDLLPLITQSASARTADVAIFDSISGQLKGGFTATGHLLFKVFATTRAVATTGDRLLPQHLCHMLDVAEKSAIARLGNVMDTMVQSTQNAPEVWGLSLRKFEANPLNLHAVFDATGMRIRVFRTYWLEQLNPAKGFNPKAKGQRYSMFMVPFNKQALKFFSLM